MKETAKTFVKLFVSFVMLLVGISLTGSAVHRLQYEIKRSTLYYRIEELSWYLESDSIYRLRDTLEWNKCYEEEFDVYWQIAQSYDAMQEYRLWEKAAEKNPEEADEYKKHMEACRQILKKNVQECADDEWLRVLEGFAEK